MTKISIHVAWLSTTSELACCFLLCRNPAFFVCAFRSLEYSRSRETLAPISKRHEVEPKRLYSSLGNRPGHPFDRLWVMRLNILTGRAQVPSHHFVLERRSAGQSSVGRTSSLCFATADRIARGDGEHVYHQAQACL